MHWQVILWKVHVGLGKEITILDPYEKKSVRILGGVQLQATISDPKKSPKKHRATAQDI
jgi:hypothetical protein